MCKILLFGSTGFIGKNIENYFKKKGNYKIVKLSSKDCNLLNLNKVKEIITDVNPDFIINGAYIGVDSNIKFTKKYLLNNLKIAENILTAASGMTNLKKIIFFGTGLEYGDSNKPISEHTKISPQNIYADVKSKVTKKSLEIARRAKLPLIIIRPFNLYGPFDTKGVVFKLIVAALKNKKISLSKGEQIRDYLYIEDLIVFIEMLIKNHTKISNLEIFNIGFGKGVLLKSVFSKIIQLTSPDFKYATSQYRKCDYFNQIADISKAKRVFKWKPSVSLSVGILKTINWVKEVEV